MAKFNDEGRMHTVEGELLVKRRGQSAVRHTTLKENIQAKLSQGQRDTSPQRQLEKILEDNMLILEQALNFEGRKEDKIFFN